MSWLRLFLLLGFIAIQGCANLAKTDGKPSADTHALNHAHLQDIASIEQFTLKGRIGVQADGKGFSGGLSWQHNSTKDDIALYSPLGGQVASIKKTTENVTLEDAKGNSISASDAETLTQSTLGWQLPLTGLADWSLGRPSNSPIEASTWDEQGHLTSLKQDGWDIQYFNYSEQNGYFLPHKISLKNEKVNLKLLVETWFNISNSKPLN